MEIDSNYSPMTYDEFMQLDDVDSFDPSKVPEGFGVIYGVLRKDVRRAVYFGQTTPERVPNRKNEHYCSAKGNSNHFDYVCRTHPDLFVWKIIAVVPLKMLDLYEALFIRTYDTVKEYNSNYGPSISTYELDAFKKLTPSGHFEQTCRNNSKSGKSKPVKAITPREPGRNKAIYIRDQNTGVIITKVADLHEAAEYIGQKRITNSLKEAVLNNGIYKGFAFSYADIFDSINHVIRLNLETGEIEKIYNDAYAAADDIFDAIKNKAKAKAPWRVADQIRRTIKNIKRKSAYGYGWTDEAHKEQEKEAAANRKLEAQDEHIVILVDSNGNEYKYPNIGSDVSAIAELLDIHNIPYSSEEELLDLLMDAIQKKKNKLFGFGLRVKPKVVNF